MIAVEENPVAALEILARPLLPASVALAVTDPREPDYGLMAPERDQMAKAVQKRRRAFAAGRRAARQALVALGEKPAPLPIGLDRVPVWPQSVIGSISHSDTICLAAVGLVTDIAAVGVDVEEDLPLSPELEPLICLPSEREWLALHPKHHRRRLGKLVFSAKESAFKCQYALSHKLLGFDDMEIRLSKEIGRFEAEFQVDADPFPKGTVLQGRFVTGHDLILTTVCLPR